MKVFWSWQSDTPGKIGRHFVRNALLAAIEDLKSTADLDEPEREAIHLDHDRKDVPGSPDLAATIFAKIEASVAVVVDVTPVGLGSDKLLSTGVAVSPRKIMNPNAAIELGYALGKHGSDRLLMVCNEHFGARQDLPFDLAHKAGPIFFRLAPDASRAEINKAADYLKGSLKEALKPMLTKGSTATTAELAGVDLTPNGANIGVFYNEGESLGQYGDRRFNDPIQDFYCASSPVVYIKILPTTRIARLVRADAANIARSLHFFSRTAGNFIRDNRWGSACLETSGSSNEVRSVAQVTLKGEIWAVNSEQQNLFGDNIAIGAIEALLQRRGAEYVKILHKNVGVPFPFSIQAGLVGAEGRTVLLDRQNSIGKIYENFPEPAACSISSLAPDDITASFLSLFERLFLTLLDERRPENFRRFPHHDRHSDYADW